MKNIILGIILGLILVVGFVIVLYGAEKHEKVECIKWKGFSTKYPDFYATQWQIEQCEHYGIDLSEYKR